MNSSVIVFPGSNCDRDIAIALEKMQFKNKMVWHKETKLPKSDLIVIPGGFSYGDYLRSGAIAGKSLIINEVIKAANNGCLILGICNGFQILTEIGLLKGALIQNYKLKFLGKDCFIRKRHENKFNKIIKQGQVLKIPVAHNEGNFYCNNEDLKILNDEGLIAFEYCKGSFSNSDENINGSVNNIAGITNEKKNVLGMMPHPERAYQSYHSSIDGKSIIESLLS